MEVREGSGGLQSERGRRRGWRWRKERKGVSEKGKNELRKGEKGIRREEMEGKC